MPDREGLSRRSFLAGSSAALAAAGLAGVRQARADSPSETVVCAVIGMGVRGEQLAGMLSGMSGARVATICEVDQKRLDKNLSLLASKGADKPAGVTDLRRVLDDKSIDAVFISTPDHWHGPATILACGAGKHVYVEKPACHNPREGELMVEAARKNKRVVQLGTQRRSTPGAIEGVQRLREGAIGPIRFARGWYNNARPSIGHGQPAAVPANLDYELWQGPAPRREYRDNLIHYNWHWFWHWGTGELGNNGIHMLDLCRWALDVDFPQRITAGGGKYHYDDDQETPDTHVVTFDYGHQGITWEGRNWHLRGFEGSTFGVACYGDNGTMIFEEGGYQLLDPKGKELALVKIDEPQAPHLQNFLDCIRSGARPNADIEIGRISTLLCQLGNIAYRTGHTLNLDPATHKIVGDPQAAALWSREYEAGWEPKV